MNLLLFEAPGGAPVAVLQKRERHIPDPGQAAGRWRRFKARLAQGYENLKEKFDYYEKMCADLRGAPELTVVHPSAWSGEEAARKLEALLKKRLAHHRRWLWVDAVLAILGGFLMPLPGPNVFFFYPAIRAFGHHHARQGAAAALAARPWITGTDQALDAVNSRIDRLSEAGAEIERLEERYHVEHLEKSLKGLRVR